MNKPPLERALTAGGWALSARILVGGSGFATTLILARLLSPQDFGVMGTAMLVLAAIEALTNTGLEIALVQRRGDIDGLYDSVFTLQLVRGAVLAALLWIAAPSAAAFFRGPVLEPVLRAVAVVLILRGLANPAKVRLVRELRYDTLFWWSLPEVAVGFVSSVVLAIVLRNVWALIIPVIAAQVVSTLVSHVIGRRRLRFAFDWTQLRQVAHFGKWVFATQVVTFLSIQGDNAFVGRVLGLGPLGFYQVAFRIAALPVNSLTQVVSQVALPSLSALHEERERLKSWYVRAQRVVLLSHGAFVALVLPFSGPLTRVLLGPTWMPIVPVLRILVVAMWLRSMVAMVGTLLNAVGQPRLTYRLQAVRLAIMAATIYPLSQLMGGLEGVAAAVLLSLIGAVVLSLLGVRRTLGVGLMDQLRQLVFRG